ncbi:MAG: DUF167 domain-containing protein [Coriobacteriia bacterium]|nr:DUF167 domain-containing protein [Coriobacteriia bacterium]
MSATLACKVTPKSGKDQVTGRLINDDGSTEVCVRVTAPPDKGKANKAVIKLLSKELGVPKSSVDVVRGDTSHHKLLSFDCDQQHVDDWVAALPQL